MVTDDIGRRNYTDHLARDQWKDLRDLSGQIYVNTAGARGDAGRTSTLFMLFVQQDTNREDQRNGSKSK